MARSLGVDRKTVDKYVTRAEEAGYSPGGPEVSAEAWRQKVLEWFPGLVDASLRRPSHAEIEPYHDKIEALVGVVPVSVIHQRLRDEAGLETSVASLRRYVRARLSEKARRADVVVWRPEVDPGEEAQVDYGYMGPWLDPVSGRRRRVWAFSMVLSYSRHLFVRPVLTMDQQAWVECHVAAFEFLRGVPRRLVPDNLRAGVQKPDLYDPQLNRAYAELAEHYGFLIDPARARHPKDKPRIEANQRYIRSSFFAGRDFSDFDVMTKEATRWCEEVAGRRTPEHSRGALPARCSVPSRLEPSLPCRLCPSSLPGGTARRSAPTPTPRWGAASTRFPTA